MKLYKHDECYGCSRENESRFKCGHNGNLKGDYVVIGTAPDKLDDTWSLHWKGTAGDIIRDVFAANGLQDRLLMTNFLQCYSQGNYSRYFTDNSFQRCREEILKFLIGIEPKYIFAVGSCVPYELIEKARYKKGRAVKEVPLGLLQQNVFNPPYLKGAVIIPVQEPPKFYEINKKPVLKDNYFKYLSKILQNIKTGNLPEKVSYVGYLIK